MILIVPPCNGTLEYIAFADVLEQPAKEKIAVQQDFEGKISHGKSIEIMMDSGMKK
ncbi:MAG: hypothetical protein Q8Q81_17445 [Oxalobacteraceae bacterium]|nr:hypothetical protein [Oxalobacteraceae bacterium]